MAKNTFVAEVTFKVCVCMSLQCHFQNQLYIIYSVKRDDPDYGITEEELSVSEDETESDFENFVCPLSSGEKYSCDEKTFLV